MGKSLQEYQQEFTELKELVSQSVEAMERHEHNMAHHIDLMTEGFNQLGLRMHALRQQGEGGAKIENFLGDKQVALTVKTLVNSREKAKAEAIDAQTLFNETYKSIRLRFRTLTLALQKDIDLRKQKPTKKPLELQALTEFQTEMQNYLDDDQKAADLFAKRGTNKPEFYDTTYTNLLNEQLHKDPNLLLSEQERALLKQQLNQKLLKLNTGKARQAALTVTAQGKLAAAAQKSKNVVALSAAKQASAAALQQVHTILAPYEKAMKDEHILGVLRQSHDGPEVQRAVTALQQIKEHADGEDHVTQSRRLA